MAMTPHYTSAIRGLCLKMLNQIDETMIGIEGYLENANEDFKRLCDDETIIFFRMCALENALKILLSPCLSCKHLASCDAICESERKPKSELCTHGNPHFSDDDESVESQKEEWEAKRHILPDLWELDMGRFGVGGSAYIPRGDESPSIVNYVPPPCNVPRYAREDEIPSVLRGTVDVDNTNSLHESKVVEDRHYAIGGTTVD